MICEENDKRVLIFGFLGEYSWMRDELHFLELDLLDRVYGEVFV